MTPYSLQGPHSSAIGLSSLEADCEAKPLEGLVTGLFTLGADAIRSQKIQYRFEGANVTRTTRYYSEANCVSDALKFQEIGQIEIKDERTNEQARHIAFNFQIFESES